MHGETDILSLGGRVALVTGAGQGLGRQIALHLAAHTDGGVAVNDYFPERATAVADEIVAAGGRAIPAVADVTDLDSVRSMVSKVESELGPIGVLVNNAGNYGASPGDDIRKPFWETGPDTWANAIGVNFYGVIIMAAAVVPAMIASGSKGRVITIVSEAARYGDPGMEIYAAAKAGAAGFTRSLARTLGRHGITANSVSISGMNTPRIAEILEANPEMRKKALEKYVIRRLGEPDDVANMVLFLASDASDWITGQTYPVNGGFTFSL